MFVPVATSTVATGIIFNWLLEPTYGIANYLLGEVGLGPYGFFQDPDQALYSIVAMTVWGWLGFDVIIYLAALQGVPQDLLEAARLDGAGRWATFRHVVWPLLGPATLFLVVWSTINALQVFDEIYVTTRGGPLHATTVLVYYIFNQAFELFHAGYAAADRLRAVRDHAGASRCCSCGWATGGCTTRHEAAAPVQPAPSGADPAVGGDAAAAGLDADHLVPDARRDASLPAGADAHRHPLENYPDAWNAAPFGRFFINSRW